MASTKSKSKRGQRGKGSGGLEMGGVDGEVREGRWGRGVVGPLELPSYSMCNAVPLVYCLGWKEQTYVHGYQAATRYCQIRDTSRELLGTYYLSTY